MSQDRAQPHMGHDMYGCYIDDGAANKTAHWRGEESEEQMKDPELSARYIQEDYQLAKFGRPHQSGDGEQGGDQVRDMSAAGPFPPPIKAHVGTSRETGFYGPHHPLDRMDAYDQGNGARDVHMATTSDDPDLADSLEGPSLRSSREVHDGEHEGELKESFGTALSTIGRAGEMVERPTRELQENLERGVIEPGSGNVVDTNSDQFVSPDLTTGPYY